MDIFVEYMVKRKKTAADYLKIFGTLVLGLILIFVVSIVFASIPFITSFILLAVAGVVYLMYHIITSVNVEYEYALTNAEIDVDEIINIRKRKRLTTVNVKNSEFFGYRSDERFEKYFGDRNIKKVFACEDKNAPETRYIVYTEDDDKKMLLFNPNQKIEERIEKIKPRW